MFRKLEFDMIYYAYLNESPFKYYISILGGVGVQNSGKPAYIILARSPITKMQMTPKLKTTLKLKMIKKMVMTPNMTIKIWKMVWFLGNKLRHFFHYLGGKSLFGKQVSFQHD